jgi:DNA-binding NtrC family response regulator
VSAPVTIVVVDDEAVIVEILQVALEDGGYAVVSGGTGEAGLRLLESEPSSFRALVTDVDMGAGKLTGWDLAKRARELNPDVAIVYMTGGSAHDWPSLGVPGSVLIPKPFAPAQVVTAVSQLLNAQLA